MKRKIQAILVGLLSLCVAFVFVGCGEKTQDFDATKVAVGSATFTYNGTAQVFTVSYPDVETTVKYSLDNETFVTADQLATVNAGSYKVYYKLSAEGYNDYLGNLDMTIAKADATVTVNDAYQLKDGTKANITSTVTGVLGNDDLGITYTIVNLPTSGLVAGATYDITASTTNANYNVTVVNGKCTVVDNVAIKHGNTVTFASSLQEAYDKAENDDILVLYADAVLSAKLNVEKTFTIDGQGRFTVSAGEEMSESRDGNLVLVDSATPVTLTLRNVTLDAKQKCRTIYVGTKNTLVIDGATITGGMLGSTVRFASGLYVSGGAKLVMTSGNITGNRMRTDNLDPSQLVDGKLKYEARESQDLWIGANAVAEISGGNIGIMFINSNEYAKTNPGHVDLNGGSVESLYVDYGGDEEKGEFFGAILNYNGGTIGTLKISTTNSNGEYVEKTAVAGTTYKGGETA